MLHSSFQAVLCLLLAVPPAQEVAWRFDFATARQQAGQKPLLLDFGTSNCFWCKKLDASTFRDPTVIQLLNDNFVSVKIDAERQPQLAQTMRVQSYPTLILVSPEGKVLWRTDGYVEAGPLAQQLIRAAKDQPRITTRTTAPPVPPLAESPVIRGVSP